jgi:hypothetical protein
MLLLHLPMPFGAAGAEDEQFVTLTEIDVIDHVHQLAMIRCRPCKQITLTSIGRNNPAQ